MPIDGLRPPLLLTQHIPDNPSEVDKILPHAHTCFNQFVFPPYTTYTAFCSKLKYALENTGAEFLMT